MKRWQEIPVGLMLVVIAVALGFVDSGYIPDSMDCGSGMSGRGYCYDGSGFFLVPLLKWGVTVVLGIIGLAMLVGPQQPVTKKEDSHSK